jgi:uroporphyrinogen decarboxylase
MNPRQRVLATLRREPTDRPPVDLWYTAEVYADLQRHTGGATDIAVWDALGLDKIAWVNPTYTGALRPLAEGASMVTAWGCLMRAIRSGLAEYHEYMRPPLADMEDPAELEDYPWWPDPAAYDWAAYRAMTAQYNQRFATIGPWISLFEIYSGMRGLEQSMLDVYENPEFLDAALDRIESIQGAMIDAALADPAARPDMVFVSDDMGSQNGLLISPASWDAHLGPRLARWCQRIHAGGARVFYHSDGAIFPLIPRLIQAGIDILNPIQHRCPGMDAAGLRKAFGDRLIFHGGVDTQEVLPRGTPDDVRRETSTLLETLGAGGGYICCSCHNIQAGTPVENILALVETARGAAIR